MSLDFAFATVMDGLRRGEPEAAQQAFRYFA